MAEIPVLSIVGFSGSGKTTLLERLIPALRRRGLRVAVVKHHPTPGLEIDAPGKDTWRLARAGADPVVLVTAEGMVQYRRTAREPPPEAIVAAIRGVDLILTEGYKRGPFPKIAVCRAGVPLPPAIPPETVVAVVSEQPSGLPVPHFAPDEVDRLAEFIEEWMR